MSPSSSPAGGGRALPDQWKVFTTLSLAVQTAIIQPGGEGHQSSPRRGTASLDDEEDRVVRPALRHHMIRYFTPMKDEASCKSGSYSAPGGDTGDLWGAFHQRDVPASRQPGGRLFLSVVGIEYKGTPLRDQTIFSLGVGGTVETYRNADVGFAVVYQGSR